MELREEAYFYDLCIVPEWREFFDQMIEDQIKLPAGGRILELECGSGGMAIDLSLRAGSKAEVLGVDPDPQLIMLAAEKARIRKADHVNFSVGELTSEPSGLLPDKHFSLVIADTSLIPWRSPTFTLDDLARVTAPGGSIALKLASRGSFDELFSICWEALFDLGMLDCSPALEAMIESRPLVAAIEQQALRAGLAQVRSLTRNQRFQYPTGAALFDAPLIRSVFLDSWLAILPDGESRRRLVETMTTIIDRERRESPFDFSVKATLILANTGR